LFSDLSGKESEFAGVMTLDTVSPLVCQGNSVQALKRSLSGRVRIAVRDGVFPGVNMLGIVRDSGKKGQEALSSAGAEPVRPSHALSAASTPRRDQQRSGRHQRPGHQGPLSAGRCRGTWTSPPSTRT
jgi:hypothetical protein